MFCFGFSRGAFVARKVADLVGELGFLNVYEMESFHIMFNALVAESKSPDSKTLAKLEADLAPFRAKANQQMKDAGGFLIK